jgi:hypothetical protein
MLLCQISISLAENLVVKSIVVFVSWVFSPRDFKLIIVTLFTELFHSIANELNSMKQLCEQWILV